MKIVMSASIEAHLYYYYDNFQINMCFKGRFFSFIFFLFHPTYELVFILFEKIQYFLVVIVVMSFDIFSSSSLVYLLLRYTINYNTTNK